MHVSITQLVLDILLKNGIHPFHDFYNFNQQICHCAQSHTNLKFNFFVTVSVIYELPRLTLTHAKTFDQEFWPLIIEYGSWSKGFRTRGQSKYVLFFLLRLYVSTL